LNFGKQTDIDALAEFLVAAKRRTYAGADDSATISSLALPGSKQLEHRSGRYFYRDIYFGMSFFAGQETVSLDEQVIWSLCYAGGTQQAIAKHSEIISMYAFLRKALLEVAPNFPFRGPAMMKSDDFEYENIVSGDIFRFSGVEYIRRQGTELYTLNYVGGCIQ